MIDMELIPGDRVGSIRLGMRRSEVLSAIGDPSSRFTKTPESAALTDSYDDLGIHVFYTESETVEFIETWSHPNVRHLVSGLDGFATAADQLISVLGTQGHECVNDRGYSYTFSQPGVSFWRSDPDETYFESIGVARPQYFDDGDA